MTLSQAMKASSGRPSGFDYMRIVLSVLVLAVHAVGNSEGTAFARAYIWGLAPFNGAAMAILPMFFALSGFLVTGSLYRCATLIKFLGLRVFRIYPALAVEVLLTAFLLGPFVTSLSVQEYFTSSGFYRYLMNITGHTTIYLPHTFATNPKPDIANIQIWTVVFELFCYIALSLLAIFGGKRDRRVLLLGAIGLLALSVLDDGMASGWQYTAKYGPVSGTNLVLSFLAGVTLYAYQDKVRTSRGIALFLIAATLLLFNLGYWGQCLAVLTSSYLTCVLGVMNPPKMEFLKHADLSYGVFLYHAIIQQTLIYFAPWQMGWVSCLLLSLALSIVLAHLSWTYVEKPALRHKTVLDGIEKRFLERIGHFRTSRMGSGSR